MTYKWYLKQENVDMGKKGKLKRETVSLQITAQNNAIKPTISKQE